jgi:hypothetical protein
MWNTKGLSQKTGVDADRTPAARNTGERGNVVIQEYLSSATNRPDRAIP